MPAGFDRCRKAGGKIRTINVGDNKYMHVCILGGKTYRGEVKEKKSDSNVAEAIRRKM